MTISLLAGDPLHGVLAGAGDDPGVAGEVGVEGWVACVDEQRAALDGGELVRGGGDDDVGGAGGADDLGADLLVAAAQDVALAADDG